MNINLTPIETRAFPSTLLRILPEQPPDSQFFFKKLIKDWAYFGHADSDGNEYTTDINIKLPYSVGDVVCCKETWRPCGLDSDKHGIYCYIKYKADGMLIKYYFRQKLMRKLWGSKYFNLWRSSITMPREAIRRWLKIENMKVKRIQYNLSMEEICAILGTQYHPLLNEYTETNIATKCEFINHFNSLYAKPRPVRKAGKIVSYVAYPYSSFMDYLDTCSPTTISHLLGLWNWKGKPLTIHANPYIMLIGGKEIKP